MLKIGLVGCGRIAKRHLEVFSELNNEIQLTGVCDILPERAEETGKQYNVPCFTDYEDMLAKTQMDAISICTPSGLHAKQGVLAAKKGIHVITEKPMALSLEDADMLINECDANNVKLFVVKQNRLNPGIDLLKKAVDKGRFGKIYMLTTTVFWQRPQEYYDMADWRGTWEFDGGALMNQAAHYVDLMLWLGGPVDHVSGTTATLARNIETEDTGAAVIKFRSGAIGVIEVTMLAYPKNYEGSVTILGETGTVKIGGTALNHIDKWEFEKYDDDDALLDDASYQTHSVYGYGHLGYYRNVLKSMREDSKPSVDGRTGRKALELTLAIYKSAKTGKRISLPLNYPE